MKFFKTRRLLVAAIAVGACIESARAMPPAPLPDMAAVLQQLAALGGTPIVRLTPVEARLQPSASDAVARVIKRKGLVPPMVAVGDVADSSFHANGADIPVRIYTPKGSGPFPVLVYYHGGGWVLANLNTYDESCRVLATKAQTIVVSVGYRLAPEHRFPAAPNDAYAALLWTQKNASTFAGDSNKVSVAGESAGGNLATVVSMMARDRHTKMPTHELLIYPVTNYAFDTPSYELNATAKPLSAAMMHWFFKYYLRSAADGANPYVSPLRGDVAGLPPATVITDQIDPLMSEGRAYADKLKAAGVPVAYRDYEGVTHEFFGMGAVVAKARQAEDFAAQSLLAANTGTSESPATNAMPQTPAMPATPGMHAPATSASMSPATTESSMPMPADSGTPVMTAPPASPSP